MSSHWIEIRPTEPLLLGQEKTSTNFLSSLNYIPGRILRGAWADWLIGQGRISQIPATVQDVRMGNFFPTTAWRALRYVSPFLLSMLTCKQERGFLQEPDKANQGHGVVDTLLPYLAYQQLQQAGADFPLPFTVVCQKPGCRSRMEHESGFFSLYQDGNTLRYIQTRQQYYTHTRVALSRYRRAASERMLYTATALSPQTKAPDNSGRTNLIFIGRIEGSSEKVDELLQALNAIPIGAMRTRGYGQIQIQETFIRLSSIPERLKIFNAILADLWKDIKRLAKNADLLPAQPEGLYFSLDLLSPAVFRNQGLPSLIPTLDIEGQKLRPVFWLTRPDFAAGWSDAWGLPKPTALAARMGSVYVFRWDGPQDEAFIATLHRLETEGIGERCDEGFGECWICHPFHQEVREQ